MHRTRWLDAKLEVGKLHWQLSSQCCVVNVKGHQLMLHCTLEVLCQAGRKGKCFSFVFSLGGVFFLHFRCVNGMHEIQASKSTAVGICLYVSPDEQVHRRGPARVCHAAHAG